MRKDEAEKVLGMPLHVQVKWMREAWERERVMRLRVLSGTNRDTKVKEADTCLKICDNVVAQVTP